MKAKTILLAVCGALLMTAFSACDTTERTTTTTTEQTTVRHPVATETQTVRTY